MDKVILFDIDKTLFDREKYLGGFFVLLESEFGLNSDEANEVGKFYQEVKDEYGYFSSEAFLIRIYGRFPDLSEKLDYYFSQENLDKFLYEDSKVLYEFKKSRIGIFSKGDGPFQKAKIKSFGDIIEQDLIYVFHNKLEKLPEILEKHNDSKLTIVDDNIAVLVNAKSLNPNVRTILIDRTREFEGVSGVDFRLDSLSDIIPILSDHI